jgi:fibronectin type 3 domain-containing protein
MKIYKRLIYTGIVLLFMCQPFALAQEVQHAENLVRWTPEGMIVQASDAALSPERPVDGRIETVIYRQLEGESSFREVARVGRAVTWEEFTSRAGSELIQILMVGLETETEEELWQYIQEHPEATHYGLLTFNTDFQKAFGMVYLDEETRDLPDGEVVRYRVMYTLESGEESDLQYTGEAVAGTLPRLLAPVRERINESTTQIGVQWSSPIEGSEDAAFANIYRRTGIEGDFELLPGQLLAIRNQETGRIHYNWDQSAEPESWYSFFIEPMDIAGNTGPRSDTLQVISVDFNNLPLMSNVDVLESESGIHLAWERLPNKPWLTGIEVQRSRKATDGFVVIDTLSITETEFIDTQIVPNQTYHYEFRVVTIRERTSLPSAVARAAFENRYLPPSAPTGVTAVQEGENIRVSWDSVQEPDLYAYYVYRGTSRHDSLVVASRAITDTTTFLDESEILSGRTNYSYAVKAVNMSGLESELSDFVIIRPDRRVVPPPPPGVSGYGEFNRIRLTWRDMARQDEVVAGYHVYRSAEPVSAVAVEQANGSPLEIPGLVRLSDIPISDTAFDDTGLQSGQQFYYAVSSVDIFDVESALSPFASFRTTRPELSSPSQVSVRQINGRVEIRWNQTRQDGATGYQIFRRSRGETEPVVIGSAALEETIFNDTTTEPGTLYWYSVSVLAGEHESARSREESVVVRE